MEIERKEDEKGKEIFCVGNLIFSTRKEAEIKLDELKELKKEEAKKKKAKKTDLAKVDFLPKKTDKTETKGKGRSK